MAIPYWNTNIGNLGTYPAQQLLYIQLSAGSLSTNILTYNLLNGTLPTGVTLNSTTGVISGIPLPVVTATTYTFTVRLDDGLGNVKDGTFYFSVYDIVGVQLTTPAGTIIDTVDSVYINYQLQYVNPSEENAIFSITSGSLPPGLTLSDSGLISGWPEPPTALTTTVPTTTLYTFTVALTTSLSRNAVTYSINVSNWLLTNPPKSRIPAILNATPLTTPPPSIEVFDLYYLTTTQLPDAVSGDNYTFKIIGYDFDNEDILYQFSNMPPGLQANAETGWITGVPVVNAGTLSVYTFTVNVCKVRDNTIVSPSQTYSLLINNGVVRDIAWVTPSNLGEFDNGSICDLFVEATSVNNLQYILSSGSLPPNISLTLTGQLTGRIPFQPSTTLLNQGDSTTFTFTISAFNPLAPVDSLSQTFTMTINQTYSNPYDTVYLKAYPDIPSKKILNSLLANTTLIPTEYLYRPLDPNFGKARDVRVAHAYGIYSSTYDQYISAMVTNHYTKRIVLGPLQTAIATDENFNVIYEVVYSQVIDDLSNAAGASVPQSVAWPIKISIDDSQWTTADASDNTSESTAYTTYAPTSLSTVYPNSLVNMRTQIASVLGQYTNQALLPGWMTSQQTNGDTLGYVPAWVLCYTLPGYSSTIVSNINQNWGYTLNDIDFTVDRYYIDKTATYNWNSNLQNPAWMSLPSAYPQPSVQDAYDFTVIFPEETILPGINT